LIEHSYISRLPFCARVASCSVTLLWCHHMKHLLSLTLVLFSAGVISAETENWPQFRGPTGDGHSEARQLPTPCGGQKKGKWKTASHGKAWSSPVIWGEQVWLTTAPENGTQLFAVCVDRDSGKVLRDLKLFDVERPQFCHEFNSYASPTPVIEEGRVY